jgi:hypothetical protein
MREEKMAALKNLVIDLYDECLQGDEEARQTLLNLGAYEGLRGVNSTLDAAADYVARGFSIVPQKTGEKQPCVKWKPFQERCATPVELWEWFSTWSDAGIAVVLGKVSGLFVIDVDGKEAHDALVNRLGEVPMAPTVKSGSGKPFRYHLFFQDPGIPTKAKFTPWHDSLEFRGERGIVVLPPSEHKSGNKYRWKKGRSLEDISLRQVPEEIFAALQANNEKQNLIPDGIEEVSNQPVQIAGLCRATRDFLAGKYAFKSNWNSRLFNAACDMAGNKVSLKKAMPLLLAGAKPQSIADEQQAIATIDSAYSQPRTPARKPTFTPTGRLRNRNKSYHVRNRVFK